MLFINAVNDVAREQAQSFLREEHQSKILDAYRAFTDVDQFAAVATLDQIADKQFSLAIPRYVEGSNAASAREIDVIDALADWREAASAADSAIIDVLVTLKKEVSA